MRHGIEQANAKELRMKAKHAAKGRKNVLDEKETQLQSVITRHQAAIQTAHDTRVAHKAHRKSLEEQNKWVTLEGRTPLTKHSTRSHQALTHALAEAATAIHTHIPQRRRRRGHRRAATPLAHLPVYI